MGMLVVSLEGSRHSCTGIDVAVGGEGTESSSRLVVDSRLFVVDGFEMWLRLQERAITVAAGNAWVAPCRQAQQKTKRYS